MGRGQVGDFLLAALPKSELHGGGLYKEVGGGAWAHALLVDTIIERKAVADFLGTIWDGRHYHSQKAQLKRCTYLGIGMTPTRVCVCVPVPNAHVRIPPTI